MWAVISLYILTSIGVSLAVGKLIREGGRDDEQD